MHQESLWLVFVSFAFLPHVVWHYLTLWIKRMAIIVDGALETKEKFLENEANLLLEIGSHGNIVKFWGSVSVNGHLTLIMDFCERDLLFRLEIPRLKGECRKAEYSSYLRQTANAMEFLQSKNIVHCDLSARNILLHNDTVKLCDFGLSSSPTSLLPMESIIQSVCWQIQPPEVIILRKTSLCSDIWSFGVLIYEVFTDGGDAFKDMASPAQFLLQLICGYRVAFPNNVPDKM